MKLFLLVFLLLQLPLLAAVNLEAAEPKTPPLPCLIGHRGLLRDAPENTLAGFGACLDLRLGFELDVRRTRDGHLVCIHDALVERTTNGKGKVAELSLAQLRQLDAGRWFAPEFAGQRVPTLAEVFQLIRQRRVPEVVIAVDVKADDATIEADMVELAEKEGVLTQLAFIGRTIEEPAVRKKLRAASKRAPTAVLAQTSANLQAALDDPDSTWVYARFIPSKEEADQIRKAGKRLFLSGPPVNKHEPENFQRAREIGAEALLTDYPLECRRLWRGAPGR